MRVSYYILIIFATIFILNGCSPTRHLKENEYLLYKQSVKGNNEITYDELTALYRQKPNRRFLGLMPYVSIYNFGKKYYDSAEIEETQKDTAQLRQRLREIILKSDTIKLSRKDSIKTEKTKSKLERKLEKLNTKLREGNWIMRAPGEAPVLFDSALINETTSQMEIYLKLKGFFQSSVTTSIDTTRKKISVTYTIREGKPHTILSVAYEIDDPEIKKIVDQNMEEASLKTNERYDADKLSEERERLTKLMKNNGYFDFTRQFIFVQVDTTQEVGKAAIYISIKNPAEGKHQVYTISDIVFNTDVTNRPLVKRDTSEYQGIKYIFYRKNFSKKILNYKLRIHPGNLYSQKDVQETQFQLASLDAYKFVNINFEKKQDSVNTLTALVRTSPFDKFQISDEWGLNIGQGFIPGPYASVSFKNRNVFKGFEIFEANLRYSLEAVLPQRKADDEDKPIIMKEYGGNLSLTFPQLFFPIWGRIAHTYNPKTKVLVGYNFVDRPEYIRTIFRTALTYSWLPSITKQWNISLIDINIIQTPVIDSLFNIRLVNLPALRASFSNSIVTSLNASYIYNDNEFGVVKKSKYFRPSFEIGGNAVNAISRYITKDPENKIFGLQYFEYAKASMDVRYYFPVTRENTYAMRFNGGIVRPYGASDQNGILELPYEKFFFSGGGSSIRAWKPRRLGPGSFKDDSLGYLYEQPGHILFETSHEYRFDIFSFIDGAFFVDAGNIWLIKEDPQRPGGKFQLGKVLSQIAVGSGFGIRMDFTFLILRFDLGFKIWDPGEEGTDRFVGKYLFRKAPEGIEKTVFNIGIGYPF